MRLYELPQAYEQIAAMLDEDDPNIDEVELLLTALDDERDRKIDNVAAILTELKAKADLRMRESKRMRELADVAKNQADRLKNYLKAFYLEQGLKKVDTDRFRVSLVKNGGKTPLIIDPNAQLAPEDCLDEKYVIERIDHEIDKDLLRTDLESGIKCQYAWLGERGTSIRIK